MQQDTLILESIKKGLVSIERVKYILVISQPYLNDAQVKAFILVASKE